MKALKSPYLPYIIIVVLFILAVGSRIRQAAPPKALVERLEAHWEDILMQVQAVTGHLSPGDEVVVILFDGEYAMSGKGGLKRVQKVLNHRGITVRSVEKLAMDEDYLVNFDPLRFAYSEYLRVTRQYPDADAVLSLCGFPILPADGELPDPMNLPPLLLTRVASIQGTVGTLLNEGRIAAVVTYRENPGPGNQFEDLFEVIHGQGTKLPQKSSFKGGDR